MANYAKVNETWPDDLKTPTHTEAVTGAKRLIRLAYRMAKEDGVFSLSYRPGKRKFVLTSGRRYTFPRRGVWYVNPQGHHFGGWRDIVHDISHWAHQRFWPSEKGHAPRHVWIEKVMTDYAVKHFLNGKLVRPKKEKPPVDPIAQRLIINDLRTARVTAAIEQWEAKKRRAENAIRKLHRKQRYYARAN